MRRFCVLPAFSRCKTEKDAGSKWPRTTADSSVLPPRHREPEHCLSYLLAELGTSGSIDGQQRLVLKGRFTPKGVENIIRRYIVEYVTCKLCKG